MPTAESVAQGPLEVKAEQSKHTEMWKNHFKGKCQVEEVTLPQLLQDLAVSNQTKMERIWLLVKDKTIKGGSVVKLRRRETPVKAKRSSEDLDLTGSPLRCSFNLEENFDDSSVGMVTSGKKRGGIAYTPLATSDARSCVSKFNLESRNVAISSSLLPCWALCDWREGTLFVGSRREETGGLTLHTVTFSGPYGNKDPALRFDAFFKRHMAAAPSGVKAQTFSEARAVFNLSGSGEMSDCEDEEEVAAEFSSLQVRLHWKNPRCFLENPSLDASVSLTAQVVPGDDKMSTFQLWNELVCLKSFAGGLENRGVTWREEKGEKTTTEDLLALLEAVKLEGPRGRRKETTNQSRVDNEDSKEAMEDVISSSRQDVDFSDMLWSILHKVESYSELCLYLSQILFRIKQEELRPFLYSNCSTKLERIIHSIVRGTDSIPEMCDSLPLELLVEIGIEKLKRDYVHAFMSSYLAGKDELAPFLTATSTQDSIRQLYKLHYVLELVVTLQTYLSPSQDCLRKIVLQALQTVRGFDGEEERQDFSFNIQISHVKDHLSKLTPSIWQCLLRTRDEATSLETVAHLSVDPPSEHIVPQDVFEDDGAKHNATYFYTVRTSVTRCMS